MSDASSARYSLGEEWANAATHALGVALSLIGLNVLLAHAGASGRAHVLLSCGIYGLTLVLLYTISTLYHSTRDPERKRVLRTLDHLAIFLLIAGTYTPFMLIALPAAWGWSLFAVVWGLAVLGVLAELTALRRYRGAMVALYIAMGWVGLIALKPLVAALPAGGLWLLFGGGATYTFGVLFYQWRSLPYHHAIWHVFVLGGSVQQFFSVLWYVLPLTG